MEQTENSRPKRKSPYQRNRQQQGIWLTWLLVGSILFFCLLGIVLKDKDYSENENRKLAGVPEFRFSALADGSYLSGWSDYVADQFPGRDFWISLNLLVTKLTGQREISGIYLGDDGFLMQAPSAPNEEGLQKNLEAINAFADEHPELNSYMCVAPNAVTVLADKLPANAPVRDQLADLQRISDSLTATEFIDVTKVLQDHKEEQLFYRTDHHWTSLGAYYAFTSIAPALELEAPTPEDYTVYTVSNTFEGTLASRSGSHSVQDQVQVYAPNTDILYYVKYPDGKGTVCSMYSREALEQKDHYCVFFGGNYDRLDITTTADTGRSLLVFKDSYANCMIQFLYPYFDHITLIDPRYYYGNLSSVIYSEAVTDVLYLYNADTFLADTSLADVLHGQ